MRARARTPPPGLCHGEILNPIQTVYGDVTRCQPWRQQLHLLSMMAYDGSWSGLLASALAWLHRLVGGGGSGGGSGGERCDWASASRAGGPVERGRVVGAKIFTDHLPQHGLSLRQVLDTLGHDDTYVVVLCRRRLLDTYISLESAFRTGEWAATSDGEHGRVLAAHEARVELDPAAFHDTRRSGRRLR